MLRTLAFVGVAAVAARQLYKSGALQRFSEDVQRRAEEARANLGGEPSASGAGKTSGASGTGLHTAAG